MRDALLGDRPELVRLLVENGLDASEFLTWGRLEELYRGAPETSLLCQLLERRQGSAEPPPSHYLPLGTHPHDSRLPQVARILRELLGDACTPFYAAAGHKGAGVCRRQWGDMGEATYIFCTGLQPPGCTGGALLWGVGGGGNWAVVL